MSLQVLSIVVLAATSLMAACWLWWRRRRPAVTDDDATPPPLRLGLLAIFKNESAALAEWIDHYLSEGVDVIFLIDNNSNDQFASIVAPYIESRQVLLHHESRSHAQVAAYNDVFLPAKSSVDWLIVADLDEFMYSRPKCESTIKAYLRTLPKSIGLVTVR